ncbi:MAG: hypothetical protein K2K34_04115 [Oscillospiraceae bacterium]|nr:hypothetical protein [Oscillospiraceae bacterium]
MNIKRTVGTGKIFWYSCGIVIALAGIVWLIINGIYAVLISGEEPKWTWFYSYTKSSADIVTPWLLMAVSMAICYRYMKMCSANNISCTKQTAIFSLLSVFVSTVFAAADLLFAKLVFQPLYGGIVITRFEDESYYFHYIINDYMRSFEEDVPQTLSPYTMNTLMLIFVFMVVYYYCFFLAGCYIARCFRYGGKKIRIYYVVMTVLGIIALFADSEMESGIDTASGIILMIFSVIVIVVNFLTNPVIFLYAFPYFIGGELETIIVDFIIMAVFIFITLLCIAILGSEQFPRKKQIRKILQNYNVQNKNNYDIQNKNNYKMRRKKAMTNRLKNTIVCSLLLARKYIIILLSVGLLTAAVLHASKVGFDYVVGADILPLLLTMLSGMSFFERHNAFCTANAVSRRNRVISAGVISAVICLLVSVVSVIAMCAGSHLWISFAELIRTAAHMRMMSGGNIPADVIELFFFAEALFFLGYFLGGLRRYSGSALVMILLVMFAAVMEGSIFLEKIMDFTPAMVLLYIPSLMQRSIFTAILLSVIFAAAFFALSVKLSETTVEKRRGG